MTGKAKGQTVRTTMRTPADNGRELLAARKDDQLLVVEPAPTYQLTRERLQYPPGPKLLDLTRTECVDVGLFESIARDWTAPPRSVPRLVVALPFDTWAVLHDAITSALAPIAEHGVESAVIYQQQAGVAALHSWFQHGRLVYNVPDVLRWLLTRWTPGSTWPMVLDAAVDLVQVHAFSADFPALLVDSSRLALRCGCQERAEALALDALLYLSREPSSLRAHAWWCLGAALLARGERVSGMAALDEAATMAIVVHDPIAAAMAGFRAGTFLLYEESWGEAETRLREVIALLEPLQPLSTAARELFASAHHELAVALVRQGRGEAGGRHVCIALELRPDPWGSQAERDRRLLREIVEQETKVN